MAGSTGTFTTGVPVAIPGIGTIEIAMRWNLQAWERKFDKARRHAPEEFNQWRRSVQEQVGDILIAAVQNIILNEPAAGKASPMNYTGFLMSSLTKRISEAGRTVTVYPTAPYAEIMDSAGLPPGFFPVPTRVDLDRATAGSQLGASRGDVVRFDPGGFTDAPQALVIWCQVKMGLNAVSTYRVLRNIAFNGVRPQYYMQRAARNAEPIAMRYIEHQAKMGIPRILQRILA